MTSAAAPHTPHLHFWWEDCVLEKPVGERMTRAPPAAEMHPSRHFCLSLEKSLQLLQHSCCLSEMFFLCLSSQMHQSFAMQICPRQSEWRCPVNANGPQSNANVDRREHACKMSKARANISVFHPQATLRFGCGAGGRSQSYLVIPVLYSKSLSQVPVHLRAVLLEFELPRKILSVGQKAFLLGFPIFSPSLTLHFSRVCMFWWAIVWLIKLPGHVCSSVPAGASLIILLFHIKINK